MTRRRALPFFALALSGCALADPPADAALNRAALPASTEIPAAWSSAGAATTAVGGGWVASFRDPALAALVREALANNRDLATAAADVAAAQQAVVIAGAPILPSAGIRAGAQTSHDYDRNDSIRLGGAAVEVSWEVDLWGKLRSGEAAAAAGARAAEDEAAYARQSIAATTARGWITAIELRNLVALATRAETDYDRLAGLAREKEAAGQVSEFDVVQAAGRASAAAAARIELQAKANENLAALEVLLGRYPGLKLTPAPGFPRMPGKLSAGLPLSLLDRRPDVTAARARVVAAFYDVEVAKLARLPGISLAAAGGQLLNPDLAALGTNPRMLRAGVGLLQPIFEGGALEAEVAAMTAEQAAATAAYGQTVLSAYGEVESLLANERLLRSGLARWQASLSDAEEALRLGTDQYVAGAIDMVSLLNLAEFAIGRRTDVIESQAALLRTRVSLYLALGEGY